MRKVKDRARCAAPRVRAVEAVIEILERRMLLAAPSLVHNVSYPALTAGATAIP